MSDGGFVPPPPPPPSAGGGGQIPSRRVGEILGSAFELYRANAQRLVTIVAIVVVPLSFLSAILGQAVSPDLTTETHIIVGEEVTVTTLDSSNFGSVVLGGLIAVAIAVIISALLQAAVMRGAALASVGDPLDVQASYRYGFRRLGSVILVSLLVGLTVGVGLILLIIPGLIFLVMLSVAIPSLVVEDKRGTQAMGRSWNLVKGHFWHATGLIVLTALITAGVAIVVSLFALPFPENWFFSWLFGAVAQIIVAPFSALATVLLYIDLRARSEGLTGGMLRDEIARGA